MAIQYCNYEITGTLKVSGTGDSSFVGDVGIGTVGPAAPLHIKSTNFEMLRLQQDDANGGLIRFLNTDDTAGWYTGIAGTEKFIISRDPSNAAPIITVEQNGSVGIGTSSPGTINGTAFSSVGLHTKFGTLGRTITEGTSWGEYIMNHSGASANQRAKFIQSKGGSFNLGSYDDNGTQRLHMTVLNSGNVGIGTTSPSSNLTVEYDNIVNNHTPAVFFHSQNSLIGSGDVLDVFTKRGDGFTDGYIARFRNDSDTKLYIRGDGNVGIGTESPGRKLSVLGATPIISSSDGTTEALFYANGGLARFGAGSNAPISFQINGNEKARIDTSGNVGIGTSTPSTKLDVQGTILVNNEIQFVNTSMRIFRSGDDMRFRTGGSDRVTIQSGGNVGIGTTSPSFQLSIENHDTTTSTATLEIDGKRTNGTNGAVGELIFSNNGDTFATVAGFRDGADNKGSLQFQTQGAIGFATRMTIATEGAVTLNQYTLTQQTADSVYLLGVDSSGKIVQSTNIPAGSGGTAGPYLPLTAGSTVPLTGTLHGTSTNFSGNGDYAGSMTLGTGAAAQEANLQIGQGRTGNGFSYIDLIGDATYTDYGFRMLRGNGGPNTLSVLEHRGTGKFEIKTSEAAPIVFETTNVERVRIDSAGLVGIGTSFSQTRLQTNLSITGSYLGYLNGTASTFDMGSNVATVHNSSAIGTGTAAGLVLANNDKSIGAPSPIIAFSAKSASNTYNHTYAAIYGIRTATGADTNWTKGDIVLATGQGTGPIERMRIKSDGNVDIITPITNAFFGLALKYSTVESGIFKVNNATGQIIIGGGAAGYYPTFYAAGSEKMRITSAGNVGIGVTNPTLGKLQVASVIHVNRDSTNGLLANPYFESILQSGLNLTNLSSLQLGNSFGSDNGTYIRFQVNSTAAASTPLNILTLKGTGGVTLGTYTGTAQTGTPTYILGTDASGNVLKVLGGNIPGGGGTVTGTGTTGRLTKFTDGANGVIGDSMVTQGSQRIQIEAAGGILTLGQWDGANNRIESGSRPLFITSYTSPIKLGISGNTTMTIESSNVGIGTTSPDAKLHIYGSTSLSEMYLGENAADDKAGILKYAQGNGGGTGVITLSHYGNNSASASLAIKYGGNVGIGTDSPDTLLHLKSTGPVITLQRNNNGNAAGAINFEGSDGVLDWQIATNFVVGLGFEFNYAGSNKVYIDTDGVVGIGTTNPSASLAAGGLDVTDRIAVGSGSVGTPALHYRDDTDTGIFFGTGIIAFSGGGVERMRIAPDGGSSFAKISAQAGTYNSSAFLSLYGTNSNTFGGSVVSRATMLAVTDGTAFGTNLKFFTNNTSNAETVALTIDASQDIQFNAYGAGYLKTDASGNITADNTGGGLPGGPYLPLSATFSFPLTGDLLIDKNNPLLDLGKLGNTTGNAKIRFFSKVVGGGGNAFAIQFNKTASVDRLEFLDGSGNPNFKFNNGGSSEFAGNLQLGGGKVQLQSQPTTQLEMVTNQLTLYAGGLRVFTGFNASNDGVEIGNATGDMDIRLSGGANNRFAFLEGSSGDFGIGTASPKGKLHVLEGAAGSYTPFNESDTVVIESATPGGISLIGTGSGSNAKQAITFGTPGDVTSAQLIYDSNNSVLAIGTTTASNYVRFNSGDGVEAMRLSAAQDVGIGKTTALQSHKLSILKGASNQQLGLYYDGAKVLAIGAKSNGDGQIYAYDSTSATYRNILLGVDGGAVGGNVGIGTTTPISKLQVKGDICLYSENTSSGSDEIDKIIFKKSHPSGPSTGYYELGEIRSKTYGGYSGGLNFYTGRATTPGSYASTFAMAIDNFGRVGIGTTSPIGKTDIFVGATGYTNNITTLPVGTFSFANGSGGSSYPSFVSKSNASGAGMTLVGATDDGAPNGIDFNIRKGDNTDFTTLTTAGFTFSRFGTVLQTILRNGNVGIGTTGPQQKLDVSSSTTYQGILVRGNVAPNVCFVQNVGSTPTWKAGISGNDGAAFSISTGAASADKLIIKSNGNVGIGTFTPGTFKLFVNGPFKVDDSGDLGLQVNPADGTFSIGDSTDVSDGAHIVGSATNIKINISSNTKVTFNQNGTQVNASTITATNFILSSDERLKDNIKTLEPKVISTKWRTFNVKDSDEGYRVGVIAQELEVKHPEFVETNEEGFKSVKYIDLLISKIAELEHRIKQLEK